MVSRSFWAQLRGRRTLHAEAGRRASELLDLLETRPLNRAGQQAAIEKALVALVKRDREERLA